MKFMPLIELLFYLTEIYHESLTNICLTILKMMLL